MSKEKLVNGKKAMSGEEFFKKWNAAKEKVDNKAKTHNQTEKLNDIPLF